MVNIAIEESQELVARNKGVADNTAQNDRPQGDGARLVPSVARAVSPARVTQVSSSKNPQSLVRQRKYDLIFEISKFKFEDLMAECDMCRRC